MSNVLALFLETEITAPTAAESEISSAVANVLALHAPLIRKVKELSKRIDAVDEVVESLKDVDARERLKCASRISRASLAQSVRELSQQLGNLAALRNVLVDDSRVLLESR